jgi:hypothetical protein
MVCASTVFLLITQLYILGNIIGALFAGQVADTFGRRYGMALGAILCIIGAILQGSAQGVHTLIPGRIILGMGALCGGTAAPSYVVEWSHPAYRGVMGGMYQTLFFSGTILVSDVRRIPLTSRQHSSSTPFHTSRVIPTGHGEFACRYKALLPCSLSSSFGSSPNHHDGTSHTATKTKLENCWSSITVTEIPTLESSIFKCDR